MIITYSLIFRALLFVGFFWLACAVLEEIIASAIVKAHKHLKKKGMI